MRWARRCANARSRLSKASESVSRTGAGVSVRAQSSVMDTQLAHTHRAGATELTADERTDGVQANSRWTSTTGIVLVVLLAVEGATILDIRGLISWHIVVGVILVGPMLLKTATTGYRFLRYYTGSTAYVRNGPPAPLLRLLGPLVLLTSAAVMGTGFGLIATGPNAGWLLTAHQASFVVWFAVMTVHVLGHVRQAAMGTWEEIRTRSTGRKLRLGLLVVLLLAGVGAGAAVLPVASAWLHRPAHAESAR